MPGRTFRQPAGRCLVAHLGILCLLWGAGGCVLTVEQPAVDAAADSANTPPPADDNSKVDELPPTAEPVVSFEPQPTAPPVPATGPEPPGPPDPNDALPGADPNAMAPGSGADGGPSAEPSLRFVGPAHAMVRSRGRVDLHDPARATVAFPGAGFGTQFRGSSIAIRLAEGRLTGSFVGGNAFTVFVDSRPSVMVAAAAGAKSTVVASGLGAGLHTVWAIKRADPSIGSVYFDGFEVSADGTFVGPPPAPSHRVEFVGASALSGFGVYPSTTHCARNNSASCNAEFSYPQLAAPLLDAEVFSYVFSGKGIYRNISPADTDKTLPYMYDRIIPDDPEAPRWDFNQKPAEVVVIDAGGVDFQALPSLSADTFATAYYDFIRQIRARSPRATLICARNSQAGTNMNDAYTQGIRQAVSRSQAAGDANVVYYAFPLYTASDGVGCTNHPSIAGATRSAKTIAAVIKARMGW